jgi:branched-chain amino acid aminotransferase
MGQLVNINGKLSSADEAKVSVFDRGFLFGDSVYETIRTYDAKIFLPGPHLARLQNSASMLRLELPLTLAQIEEELNRTVAAAGNPESYVRLIVTRGEGKIGLDIHLSKRSTYVILVNPLEPLPAEY